MTNALNCRRHSKLLSINTPLQNGSKAAGPIWTHLHSQKSRNLQAINSVQAGLIFYAKAYDKKQGGFFKFSQHVAFNI